MTNRSWLAVVWAMLTLTGCIVSTGGDDGTCTLRSDGVHCRCPDPVYRVLDSEPWPCGHPTDGVCQPTEDCAADRECIASDGTRVTIGADTLTVTSSDGLCVDVHQIERSQ